MEATREKLQDLETALKKKISGDVLFDRISTVLFSTDASNFQIEPLGVVLPKTTDEICAIVEIANRYDVPLIPRGSGSSMAGQTLGRGLILDCSKYLNKIQAIDRDQRIARVEPGVILEILNQRLILDGLKFGPDPASAERATIGGMVGNNATGAHSIRYGLTIDHVLSTEVVLSDGSVTRFEPLSGISFDHRAKQSGLEGQIYSSIARIRDDYREDIIQKWPATWRRASGYSLNYLIGFTPNQPPAWYEESQTYPPRSVNNLTPLMASSEGTLAILREISLNLVPIPKAKALAVLPFASVAAAADATPALLEHDPDAIELIPRAIFERAKTIPAYARKMSFLERDPAAVLVVEFSASDKGQAVLKARALSGATILESEHAMADLWAVRKVGLGLLMSIPGDIKPITFIEDVAVPVEHLSEFVRRANQVLESNQTYGEWYAHASAGCLHLRPMVNLKTDQGVTQMHEIAQAIIEITLDLRGVISGEHGDGLSHTEYNEQLFGPSLMQAFRELKDAFDPNEILNPGKVIPAKDGFGGQGSLTSNLRFGPEYTTIDPTTVLAHRREGGFPGAIEACTGIGVCRQEQGLMCPSYQATRDEMHTTRGRANALRAAISGVLPADSLNSKEMYAVLDLCLECKGCKAECPTAVDMARIKAEFLHLYQQEHGASLRSRLFANIHGVARLMQQFAGLTNWMTSRDAFRYLQQVFLGVSKERMLPSFSDQNFRTWFDTAAQSQDAYTRSIVLFVDTYTQYMHPEIGRDAVLLLNTLGYTVDLIHGQGCCGRPMISKGFLEEARELARVNIDFLKDAAFAGIPILGLEPSCLLTLRDEYLEFFPEDPNAHVIAENSFLLEEFLLKPDEEGNRPLDRWGGEARPPLATLHNHCYSKSLVGSEPLVKIFDQVGAKVEEIDSGCCGMAGSFGYEKEHYALSQEIAEQTLIPGVHKAVKADHVMVVPGYSCRTQIRDSSGVEALHPAQYLANLLRTRDRQG